MGKLARLGKVPYLRTVGAVEAPFWHCTRSNGRLLEGTRRRVRPRIVLKVYLISWGVAGQAFITLPARSSSVELHYVQPQLNHGLSALHS